MYKYECDVCHGNCDAGELVNGVCPECLEEQRHRIVAGDKVRRMLNAPYEQMKLDLVGGNINGR